MANTLPSCPGCGVQMAWSTPTPGKLRLACACHSANFDISTASADDVTALKMAVNETLLEEHAKIMAMAAVVAPDSGVQQ